jgi:hypothetical protein
LIADLAGGACDSYANWVLHMKYLLIVVREGS